MKTSRIRDFRLIILIPVILFVALVLLLVVNRSTSYMAAQTTKLIQKIESKKGEELKYFFNKNLSEIERLNYTLSYVPFVKNSFEHYKRYGNANEAGEQLKTELRKFSENYHSTLYYNYQFTLNKKACLLRTQDSTIGRLINSYEVATSELLDTTSMSGTTNTRSGFEFTDYALCLKSIRSLVINNELMGAVEVHLTMDYLVNTFYKETNQQAAFFVDFTFLDQSLPTKISFLRAAANEKKKIVSIGNIHDIEVEEIQKLINVNNLQDVWLTPYNNYLLEFHVIKDMSGSRIGFWVTAHDLSDQNSIYSTVKRIQYFILPILIFLFALILFLILTVLVTNPLYTLTERLNKFVLGDFPEYTNKEHSIELRRIHKSIDQLVNRSKEITIFAREIGSGNFDAQYHNISTTDLLGNALVEMRDKLLAAEKKTAQREDIERKERWLATGIAQMSDILRMHSNNVANLNDAIITFLVNYLDIIQGAVYTVEQQENDEDYLKLSAAYSYQQKRHINKHIKIGEGLIGTCAAEKEPILLTNVPEGHIKILSGLGESSPSFVFMYPLMMNQELFGVIELNNFKEVEPHRLQFVEKISESYAATLSNVKINERTAQLLKEYKQQGEELIAHEDAMRERLEQILVTQEEALRKERKAANLIESIDKTIVRIELTKDGMISNANSYFLDLIEELTEAVVGRHLDFFVDYESRIEIKKATELTAQNKAHHCQLQLVDKFGNKVKLVSVFSPILNNIGDLANIHFIAQRL